MPPKKATAPKPKQGGYEAAAERHERAAKTLRIELPDSEFSFVYRPYGIPVRVRGHVRDVTGKTVDVLLYGADGTDVSLFADAWWVSRLCADEVGADGRPVSRAAVQAEFDELCAGAVAADFVETDATDEVDDSPKA